MLLDIIKIRQENGPIYPNFPISPLKQAKKSSKDKSKNINIDIK